MKKNDIKISIIVPVYNVEQYLEKCLTSLVKQTLKGIEIIVVNDGTKDNSQKIIDKFVKKYKKVKSFIKENGGLSSARNYGLKYASGEYIAFVDSDDYVEKDMYEIMYKKAKEQEFDMVVCNLKYIYPDKEIKAYSNIKKDIFKKSEIKKCMANIYPAAWNKIYKKELFSKGVLFKEQVWFEDVEFLYRLMPYIDSIGVARNYGYNYVQRDGAITKTFDDRLFHYIDNWNGIIKFYKDKKLYNEYYKELEYSYVRYLYATFIKAAANFKDKKMFDKAVSNAIRNVKEQFPKYRRNKYFYMSKKGIYLLLFNSKFATILYGKLNK